MQLREVAKLHAGIGPSIQREVTRGLVQLTIVFAILLVGVLPETRLYVELIPFLTGAVVVAAARFSSNLA